MYINLPVDIKISNLVQSELREIHSDSAKIKDFIFTIHQHLASNNIYEKFDKYMETIDNDLQPWIQANNIDDQIGLAIQTAKKQCQTYRKPPWSEKLHHASLVVRY